MLTREQVERLFLYNAETGELRLRKVTRGPGIGYVDIHGYRQFYIRGQIYPAHKIIWLLLTGSWEMVDHRNGDSLDNRAVNLRAATKSQNAANMRKSVKGVSFCSTTGRWRADIKFKGKGINLGRYPTVAEAKAAYDKKARELFGEYMCP